MKSFLGLLAIFLITGLGACSYSDFGERDINVAVRTHNATSRLMAQTKTTVSKETPIVVATLSNINELETSSPLGRKVSDSVMTYLVKNGYSNVSEIRLRRSLYLRESGQAASGEFILSRDARAIAETREVGAAITGTYAIADNEVLISLRMIEIVSAKVLAAVDFRFPKDSDVEELLKGDSSTGSELNIFSSDKVPSF